MYWHFYCKTKERLLQDLVNMTSDLQLNIHGLEYILLQYGVELFRGHRESRALVALEQASDSVSKKQSIDDACLLSLSFFFDYAKTI